MYNQESTKMNTKVLVLHHDDNDGCCAAWVVKHYYDTVMGIVDVATVPVQYNQEPPFHLLDKDTTLYIVDFSYKRPILLQMKDMVKEIHVFDHHATAKEELEGLEFAKFSNTKAGAGLTWEILFNGLEPLQFIKLVDDYDLWKFEFNETEAFHSITGIIDAKNMKFWDDLCKVPGYYDHIVSKGKEKLYYENLEITKIVTSDKIKFTTFQCNGKEYKVAIYKTTHNLSKIGNRLLKDNPDLDFTFCWFIVPKDGSVVFSMRSTDIKEVNLGKDIAKLYGGGGHKNAAGFSLPLEEGLKMVESFYKVS